MHLENQIVAKGSMEATAKAKDMVLVTHEVSGQNSHKKIKIPDVADAMNVRYCTLVDMLRDLTVTV